MDKGRRLAELRGTRKQKEIATAVGVKPQAVSNWERGKANVDQEHVEALDKALGAGGEVIALYARGPEGLSLADLDAKLDQLIAGQNVVQAAVSSSIADATTAVTDQLVKLGKELASLRRRLDRADAAGR